MGFMDKAKKYAEQAQTKLDEVQKQFNEQQGAAKQQSAGAGAPPVEYDQHGRPVRNDSERPHGDPLAQPSPASAPEPAREPVAPTTDPEPPHGDPLADASPKPPKPPAGGGMTSGDPLAG